MLLRGRPWAHAAVTAVLLWRGVAASQTAPPDPTRIPADDLLGVTVVLLECLYRGAEFTRIGYYVSNYPEVRARPCGSRARCMAWWSRGSLPGVAQGEEPVAEALEGSILAATGEDDVAVAEDAAEEAAAAPRVGPVDIARVVRRVLADRPRVTRFPIEWA